jgi:hypothetical protein
MALSVSQLQVLRQDIAADPAFADLAHNQDGAAEVADAYNAPASPAVTVWRTSLPPEDYTGEHSIVWTAVDQLQGGKARIFEWMSGMLTRPVNMADPNVRQGITDAFGVASQTRTNLFTLGTRLSTRGEALFATGPGSTQAPATMSHEGVITTADVMWCWWGPGA